MLQVYDVALSLIHVQPVAEQPSPVATFEMGGYFRLDKLNWIRKIKVAFNINDLPQFERDGGI